MSGKQPRRFGRDFLLDPYPDFAELRAGVPPVMMPDGSTRYVVCGYADAKAALTDPRFTSSASVESVGTDRQLDTRADDVLSAALVNSDPPTHTRLRRMVAPGFERCARSIPEHCAALATRLIAELAARDQEVDLIGEFAAPLSTHLLAQLLGVGEEAVCGFVQLLEQPASAGNVADSVQRLVRYFHTELYAGRDETGVLADLANGHRVETRVTAREVFGTGISLVFAGHVTTVLTIGLAATHLASRPGLAAAVRADPRRYASAVVEETLRYDSPVFPGVFRYATTEVDLGGGTVPAGGRVLVALGAANRDPAVFPEPDTFDAERSRPAQLSFGHGRHYCLGAKLARIACQAAVSALAAECDITVNPADAARRPSLRRTLPRLRATLRPRKARSARFP